VIFNEFKNTMDNQTSKINGENTLFWKLWCLTFAFDKIGKNYSNYNIIEDCYKFLWEINDGEHKDLNIENSPLDSIEKFSDIEYDDLDDFDVSECVILCQENGQGKLRFCFKSKRAIACSPHKQFKGRNP